jgi:hypothetical protein
MHLVASLLRSSENDGISSVLSRVVALRDMGRIVPLALQIWRKYDETPFHLRVRWSVEELPDLEPAAKLVAIERGVGVLITAMLPDGSPSPDPKHCVHMRFHLTTVLRVASSMTGAAVRALVEETMRIPMTFAKDFLRTDHIIVTDEHASNLQVSSVQRPTPEILH